MIEYVLLLAVLTCGAGLIASALLLVTVLTMEMGARPTPRRRRR